MSSWQYAVVIGTEWGRYFIYKSKYYAFQESFFLFFIFTLQDVLSFLENRKENRSWYKASRVTVAVSIYPRFLDLALLGHCRLVFLIPIDSSSGTLPRKFSLAVGIFCCFSWFVGQVACILMHVWSCMQILDDTFASQMQRLQGNAMQEKDLEPPRSVMEVRSILCKDAPNHKDSNYFYY